MDDLEDLRRQQSELTERIKAEEEAIRVNELKERAERNATVRKVMLSDGYELLDAIAPEHREGRYNRHCSDAYPCGMDRYYACNKDHKCLRCSLMDFLHAAEWDDKRDDIDFMGAVERGTH